MQSQSLRGVKIEGWGKALPERVLTNHDLEQMVDTSDEWITSRTGIRERRVAGPETAASDLALVAAKEALAKAALDPEKVDLVIVATVTPDMAFPATACLVQSALAANRAAAFDLEAGCSGFLYALTIGREFVASGTYDHVLVIGVDLLSRITNWRDRNTCVLFGDGAGAVVLGPTVQGEGILSTYLGSDGSGGELLCLPAGGSRLPLVPENFEQGLQYIHMNGPEVFKFAVRVMGEAAVKALELAGLNLDDVTYLIPHQANLRIIDAAAKRLKLPSERVLVNLDRYGNMSSASIPVALAEAADAGRFRPGDILVLVGFGAGLTWGASVVRW
ncbi:MAG: 3-oxoacyl-[acyl-carrier-protein] synthase [Bacillota bacterium]|jgi:3-oxoacyl-[acyl-carrier-protein] synthase-3|nr:3-oxoacyl-[acyl-carrier-protein] synthase [Bacillota bacterium]MDK2882172.1 3-oxoacyl-[acyl-carrier-protein] synthase [Bacillota bacterium]MDK2960385.1 3-oxoacyl-[acyl-carrier-protein] synthase [Bacillota bacterium]